MHVSQHITTRGFVQATELDLPAHLDAHAYEEEPCDQNIFSFPGIWMSPEKSGHYCR